MLKYPHVYWKGSSWRLVIVLRYDRFALTVSIETYKKFSQIVSTSNKRPSSGKMKKDQKRVDLYRDMDLTLILIKDDLWRLIFTPHLEVDWSVISVIFRCGEICSIKPDMHECVFTPYWGGGDEGMTLLNSCQIFADAPQGQGLQWTLSITGSAKLMDVTPHMWERCPELLGRGPRNTPSPIHQQSSNTVDHHHPLPSINNFTIIDKDPSQDTQEAKEAIHIRRLDPNLDQNIGKMSILHCFDPLISAKPEHPQVGILSQSTHPVDEVAPPSQIPGLNLTQFNNIGSFQPNQVQNIPRHSTRACRARNLFN